MRIGIAIEAQEGIGWALWKQIARWSEDLGFESLWRSDHHISLGGNAHLESIETFVALTYLATHTKRIRFGPLVCCNTFRHPALVARMSAAIGELSGGRLVLGVGAGWFEPEHDLFGIPFPPLGDRIDALEEAAQVIRRLLDGEEVRFSGQHYEIEGARIRPSSPVPLLVGGGGERRTLAVVARSADEWNVPGLPLDRYRHKVDVLHQHCARIGRDPRSISRSIVYTHAVGATAAEAEATLQRLLAQTPPQYRPGANPDAPEWLVGEPNAIVDQIAAVAEEGVERIMFQFRRPPSQSELGFISESILPFV